MGRAIFPGESGVFSGKVAHQSQRHHDISSRLSVGTKVRSSRSDTRMRARRRLHHGLHHSGCILEARGEVVSKDFFFKVTGMTHR